MSVMTEKLATISAPESTRRQIKEFGASRGIYVYEVIALAMDILLERNLSLTETQSRVAKRKIAELSATI